MSDSEFLVKPQPKKWGECCPTKFPSSHQAIEHAKARAVETGEPHEVYEITLIGSSAIPQSKFIDFRPQTGPQEGAANS